MRSEFLAMMKFCYRRNKIKSMLEYLFVTVCDSSECHGFYDKTILYFIALCFNTPQIIRYCLIDRVYYAIYNSGKLLLDFSICVTVVNFSNFYKTTKLVLSGVVVSLLPSVQEVQGSIPGLTISAIQLLAWLNR